MTVLLVLGEEFHVTLKLRGLLIKGDIVNPDEDVLLWSQGRGLRCGQKMD